MSPLIGAFSNPVLPSLLLTGFRPVNSGMIVAKSDSTYSYRTPMSWANSRVRSTLKPSPLPVTKLA